MHPHAALIGHLAQKIRDDVVQARHPIAVRANGTLGPTRGAAGVVKGNQGIGIYRKQEWLGGLRSQEAFIFGGAFGIAVDHDDVLHHGAHIRGIVPKLCIKDQYPRSAIGGNAHPIRGVQPIVQRHPAQTRRANAQVGFDVGVLIGLQIENAIPLHQTEGFEATRQLHDAPTRAPIRALPLRTNECNAIPISSHRASNEATNIHD